MAGKSLTLDQQSKTLDSGALVEANKRWNDWYGENRERIQPAVQALRRLHEAREALQMTEEEYETAKALCYREHRKVFDEMAAVRAPVIDALRARQENAKKIASNPLAARMIDDTLSDSLSPGHEKITRRHFTAGAAPSKTNLADDIEF